MSPFSTYLLNRRGGLRLAMLTGTSMLLLAACLRSVPATFYSPEERAASAGSLLWWVIAAQARVRAWRLLC